MVPKYDFHTHTHYLKCANETMTIPAMFKQAEELGVTALGVTDHLNTLDKLSLHECIRRDMADTPTTIDVYFGVELNFLECDGGFAYNSDVVEETGFQFAIGGIHGTYCAEYDLTRIIDIQHRHHLRTCEDPLVDVLVHPYWFGKGEFDKKGWPWFDSVRVIPEAYARELGQAARETGTAIEINGCANLDSSAYPSGYVAEYGDYLAILAEEGCLFSVGSDAHDINRMSAVRSTWEMVDRLGLPPERVWSPQCAPFGKAPA